MSAPTRLIPPLLGSGPFHSHPAGGDPLATLVVFLAAALLTGALVWAIVTIRGR